MQTEDRTNLSPLTPIDRRRFLLLAALATLSACGPITVRPLNGQGAGEASAAGDADQLPASMATPAPTRSAPAAPAIPDDASAEGDTGPARGPTVVPDAPLPRGPQPPHAAPPQLPVPGLLNTHGDRSRPLVALTFDACETPYSPAGYDTRVVEILTAAHAPATMFLCGHWVATHSGITRRLAANPLFELGNHSWDHPDFSKSTPDTMALEIERAQTALYQLTGHQPALFRMPYGNWNRAALAAVGRAGLHTIQWDVVTGDPDPNVKAAMIKKTVQQKTRNGSIIVMHMNGRGVHTAEALPDVITSLRAQGYILATVSQALGLVPLPS